MNRFQLVEDDQRRHGAKQLCTVLGIARSSSATGARPPPDRATRQAADAKLSARIRAVHRESDGTYGVPRITAELREDGERVNHKRITRVMRTIDLAGVRLHRRHRTTVHRRPGCCRADQGSLKGAVMHTDHGAQYTSRAFAGPCHRAGVLQSMSAVGSSADNAAAERFNATFESETLKGRKGWSSEREARLDASRWLHRYNTRRRHARLGHRSPIAYETAAATASTTLTEAP